MPQPLTLNQLRFTGCSLSGQLGVSPLLHCHFPIYTYVHTSDDTLVNRISHLPRVMWYSTEIMHDYGPFSDEWKDTFHTNRGLYKSLVMVFGLHNSPATFQGMMNDILQDFIDWGVAMCYMDDILVHTQTLEEHWQVVQQVLSTLHWHKLFLKLEKCKFKKKWVDYLSLIISKGHIKMAPMKVQGVVDWHVLHNVKEVRSFLGFMNFYCHFICDFSNITKPLNVLTCRAQTWPWGNLEQKAFKVLKEAIMSALVLLFLSDWGHFFLECDALNFTMGVVLSQQQDDKTYHPDSCQRVSLI